MTARNIKRAKRAEKALKAAKYWDCGESYAVTDALSDLRHLCERKGWDFADLLRISGDHYAIESGVK